MIEDSDVAFLMLASQFSYEEDVSYSIKEILYLNDELCNDA